MNRAARTTEGALDVLDKRVGKLERSGRGFSVPAAVATGGTIASDTPPPAPSDSSILWIDTDDGNKIYRWNGLTWIPIMDPAVDLARNRAATAMAEWQSKNNVPAGLVVTFWSSSTPASPGLLVGDAWVSSVTGEYHTWNGSSWLPSGSSSVGNLLSLPALISTVADGKIRTWWQFSEPVAEGFGDLWARTADTPPTLFRWNNFDWIPVLDWEVLIAQESADDARDGVDTINNVVVPALQDQMTGPGGLQEQIDQAETRHNDAINAIEDEQQQIRDEAVAGDSVISQRITDEVTSLTTLANTKSKHTLSPDLPGTTLNNVGDVWERHKAGDATKIIGRWRGQGGTLWAPMDLDATYIPLLDIGTGTFGDLSGARLLAGTIAASKLMIADMNNYAKDPDFTLGLWEGTNGLWENIAATTPPPSGKPRVMQHVRAAAGGAAYLRPTPLADLGPGGRFTVTPGDKFRVKSYVRRTGTMPTAGKIRVGLWIYDKDGVYLTSVNQAKDANSIGDWTEFAVNVDIPAGSATAWFFPIYLDAAVDGGTWEVGGSVTVLRRLAGELIVDGSIITDHLAANFVESLLVTGKVLQTDLAADVGVKISNSGILMYHDKVAKFVANPSTGLVEMVGGTIESSYISGDTEIYAPLFTNGAVNITSKNYGNTSKYGANDFGGVLLGPPDDVMSGGMIGTVAYISSGAGGTWGKGLRIDGGGYHAGGLAAPEIVMWRESSLVGGGYLSQMTLKANRVTISAPEYTKINGLLWGDGRIEADGNIVTNRSGTSGGLYDRVQEGSSGQTATWNQNGRLVRSGSSIRYKENVQRLRMSDLAPLLDVTPVSFTWKPDRQMGGRRVGGLIAEELDAAGGTLWVDYNDAGQPDGVRYGELSSALLLVARWQRDQIKTLTTRVTALESRGTT